MRVGLGDAQGQGHGFLRRVLQTATVQSEKTRQTARGRIQAVRPLRLRVRRQRWQCNGEVAALFGLL
jgi:hypothetical protein